MAFKSDFAKECSNSFKDLTDLGEEGRDWLSHDKFRELLEMREQTIRRSASSLGLHTDSPRPPLIPRVSRRQTLVTIKPDLDLGERREKERLEAENMRLRKQLETVTKGEMMDTKYASLASEVMKLQNSVTQVSIHVIISTRVILFFL